MSRKLAVLFVHGIGSQKAGYSHRAQALLNEEVRALGSDDARLAFEEVLWAPVLQDEQEALLGRLTKRDSLRWMELRSFVVHYLSDAIAYQDTAPRGEAGAPAGRDQVNVYRRIHEEIGDAMARLRSRLGEGTDDVPLVVVAHSLGCHMISNYVWDVRKQARESGSGATSFEAFGTLTGIVTLGCNIPLFTLAYTHLEPVAFPTPGIGRLFPGASPEEMESATQWLNFYDPDDVLGYPLKVLGRAYEAAVTHDVRVNVGNVLHSWNPLSHDHYWTDRDVVGPTAELLDRILRLSPG